MWLHQIYGPIMGLAHYAAELRAFCRHEMARQIMRQNFNLRPKGKGGLISEDIFNLVQSSTMNELLF